MSKMLASFSGQFGDIVWSLPTVRALSQMTSEKFDFCCMPEYKSLLPLIQAQPYIDNAFAMDDWHCWHRNFGCQPWNPPGRIEAAYQRCWHLGYREHPGRVFGHEEMQLINFIAHQQGIRFTENPLPFLTVPELPNGVVDSTVIKGGLFIAYAFNDQYKEAKDAFLSTLKGLLVEVPLFAWVDVSQQPWLPASMLIKEAACFVGCRSANYVIAHGVGQKLLIYEPHPGRHPTGHLGFVFGCNYGKEIATPLGMPPEQSAEHAVPILRQWIQEKENQHEQVAVPTAGRYS